jgi:tetratricopeptide (TPR) repeat protein
MLISLGLPLSMRQGVAMKFFASIENRSNWARFLTVYLPLILLVIATLAAYANAWPNALVFDDKYFAGSERYSGLQDFPRFFTEDVWAAAGGRTGLYRPLLLISLSLDSLVYGDWMAGYHLSNIFLHVLVTVVVFGFVRQLLRMTNGQNSSADRSADIYAFLAALVFGVHPIHTEVVNSIFNRSESLVALAGAAGLWWFLYYLDSRPARAWGGLAMAYLIAIFAKESAVVLPGLAVALVLIFTPGSWHSRLQKCLPALWLLIPLALYLVLRAQALAVPDSADTAGLTGVTEIKALVHSSRHPDWRVLLNLAGNWGEAFKAMVWPYPLKLYYDPPTVFFQWSALVLHLSLITAAVFGYRKKRFGLIAGLAFFYIAMLPASQFIGLLDNLPSMAERYLYFPSAGLAIWLAFGLRFLGRRFSFSIALAPVMVALVVLTPLCWARNAEWANEVILFESEYRNGGRGETVLSLLTSARFQERNYARVIEICDLHVDKQKRSGKFSNNCALAYSRLGRNEEAERAFLFATRQKSVMTQAHNNLATYYLRLGRRGEARKHFELAIETESIPALHAYRKGKMLVLLHRTDRAKLAEAKSHFEEALRLQPGLIPARRWVERLNRTLGSP